MVFHNLAYPPQSGVQKRNFHLLEETVKRHEVTIVSYGSPADEASIRQYFRNRNCRIAYVDCSAPKWINLLKRIKIMLLRKSLLQISATRRMQHALDEIYRKHGFDLIFLSSPALLHYRKPAAIPCVIDAHNVEYDLHYRSYQNAKNILSRVYFYDQYRLMKQDEIGLCRQPNILLTTSERDKALFEKDLPDQFIRVIPNGVDLNYFLPQETQELPHSMVFSGMMNYLPNNRGILYFLDNVMPLILKKIPDAKIFIVGAAPSKTLMEHANEHVVVTGRVEDVRPYIAQAQVYVIPLLIGGGTRLKALEASAMKKPIVSTSIGCEGIDFHDGESALFADTPEAFSEAVLQLFDNREYRSRLAERAYSIVSRKYSWQEIGDQLNSVFESVVRSSRGTGEYRNIG
jgi:glycosyltransferase involved in cell wall biosynthesis